MLPISDHLDRISEEDRNDLQKKAKRFYPNLKAAYY